MHSTGLVLADIDILGDLEGHRFPPETAALGKADAAKAKASSTPRLAGLRAAQPRNASASLTPDVRRVQPREVGNRVTPGDALRNAALTPSVAAAIFRGPSREFRVRG